MEVFGALFDDEEYESLTKMFDYINPADYFMQESSIFPSDSNFCRHYFEYSCSQESSNSTGIDTSALFAVGDHENQTDNNSLHDHLPSYNNMFESMSFYDGHISPDNVIMGDILSLNPQISCTNQNVGPEKEIQLKRKYEGESSARDPDCRKKKARISRNVEKNQRGVVHNSKRKKKVNKGKNNRNEESADIGNRKQSLLSGSCSDDQDDRICKGLQEVINGEAGSTGLNSDGKARASRGSATDPQSLYAKRRRERINERLRILQNLVPNGTKVDISTMLEEAVHYVKFLQLQIKLLSSDDMWMYALIALGR